MSIEQRLTDVGTAETRTAGYCQKETREMSLYLWKSLLPGDTWDFRQAWCYGFPLFPPECVPKEKEEKLLKQIFEAIGTKIDYIDAAYHSIDDLSAIMAGLSFDGELLTKYLRKLTNATEKARSKFEDFLQGSAEKAFVLNLDLKDPENPKFNIEDLPLDKEELRQKWTEFSEKIGNLAEKFSQSEQ